MLKMMAKALRQQLGVCALPLFLDHLRTKTHLGGGMAAIRAEPHLPPPPSCRVPVSKETADLHPVFCDSTSRGQGGRGIAETLDKRVRAAALPRDWVKPARRRGLLPISERGDSGGPH